MIKTPSELYPKNSDIKNLPLTFTPPPTSFLAQFEQLSTFEKYVENQIQKGENDLIHTLKPILDIINQLEMLVFDFAVFLDGSHRDQIHEFFEKSFSINEGNYSFSLSNPKSILSHIKYLLSILGNISVFMKKQPFYESSICIGDPTNTHFEDQLNSYLQASSQFFSEFSTDSDQPEKTLNINCNFKSKIETDSKEFAAWLLNLYRVTPSVKITDLANRLAFRLTTIFDLQESITKMRELSSTSETARENELYDIDSIKKSEKYKLLNQRCHFLSVILKYINLDPLSEAAYQLTCDIEKQGLEFDKSLQKQHEAYFNEIKTYDKWINDNEIAVKQLKQNLTPLAKQHINIFNEYLPNPESSYNTFAFPKAITYCRSNTNNDSEKLKKIDQIYTLYNEICRIYDDGVKRAYKIRDLEFEIIDVNSKIMYCDDPSEIREFKNQADNLSEQLNYFLSVIKPDNHQSEELIMKLQNLGSKTQQIEENIFNSIEKFNEAFKSEFESFPLPTDIAKKRDELLSKIREADANLVKSRKFVYDIREKKASMGKWSEISTELIGANVNSVYQSNYAQMEKMVICPACKANYRNVLIEECGHIVCSFCFDECRCKKPSLCPQCGQPFKMNEFEILERPKIYGNVQVSKEPGA